MDEYSEKLEAELIRAHNDHAAVLESIYDSMRATGEFLSVLNDRQDRFEMKMDRMEGKMDKFELRMMNVETAVEENTEEIRYIRHNMVTQEEFHALDNRVVVLENKVA